MKKILFFLIAAPVFAQAQQKFEEVNLTEGVKKIKVKYYIFGVVVYTLFRF